jgi:hypothetical protein
MKNPITRRSWLASTASLLVTACLFTAGITTASAAGKGNVKGPGAFKNTISLAPKITDLQVSGNQLLASGTVTATLKGTTYTAPFSNVPAIIAVAPGQENATCPILDLTLGEINLNLLGLVLHTDPICLQITAQEGELLGDLLCAVANLLNGGLNLEQILAGAGLLDPLTGAIVGLSSDEIGALLPGLTNLLNGILANILGSIIDAIEPGTGGTCSILHLELGPLDLNLLGLLVELDNCDNGPVVVDLSAVTGPGNLLGNLLCQLVDGGLINLGTTLQGLLNQLLVLALLNT